MTHPPDHPMTPTPTPSPDARGWTSWELHLASSARSASDRAVTDVVGPVVTGPVVTGRGAPWFFLRYWQGGPHVRLRVAGLDRPAAAALTAELADRLAVAGRLTDDEAPLDAAEHLRAAAGHAAGETGLDRVVQPLRVPGVHPGSYAPETERYGGPDHLAAAERLFCLSSGLALGVLSRAPSPAARAGLALQATAIAASAVGSPAEQAVFPVYGLGALRGLVEQLGHPRERIDGWLQVPPWTGAADRPGGPLAAWRGAVEALAGALRPAGTVHPGGVLSSHVHMLHNRLGLGLVEEMRTYAALVAGTRLVAS